MNGTANTSGHLIEYCRYDPILVAIVWFRENVTYIIDRPSYLHIIKAPPRSVVVHHTANTSDAHVDCLCTSVGCHFSLLATSPNAGSSLCNILSISTQYKTSSTSCRRYWVLSRQSHMLPSQHRLEKSALLKVVDNHISNWGSRSSRYKSW